MTRLPLLIAGSAGALLALASPASASFHFMKVSEVMLQSGGNPAAQFVEFTDDALPSESFPCTGPYRLVAYNAGGSKTDSQDLDCGGDLAPFVSGGGRLYVASAEAVTSLGVLAEKDLTVDLPTGAGQVCFTNGAGEFKVSCIAWGCPTGATGTSTSTQLPGDGQSLQRQAGNALQIGAATPDAANATGSVTTPCASSGGAPGGGGGGGGSGATTPPPADKAPTTKLAGAGTQRLGKSISVKVSCPTEPCAASAAGSISVSNASKLFRVKSASVQIAKGASATLKLKLSSKARKAIRKALGKGKKVRAKITVTATNTAGTTTAKKTIKLKS